MGSLHQLRSRYMNGAPKTCSHPGCHSTFDGAAYEGKTGKLYCTRACRADMSDEPSIEELARRTN